MSDTKLYETDIAQWANEQAALLRRRAAGELVNEADIDWLDIAEEIEDVARRVRDQIYSRLANLCEHLLKWQFQPDRQSSSWRGSIIEARNRIAKAVRDNPSLRSYPGAAHGDAYADGRRKAEGQTGLTMPAACPWTVEQVLDHGFWPHD